MRLHRLKRLLQSSPIQRGFRFHSTLSQGDRIHGYKVKRVTDVPEFSMIVTELEHDKTKAKHLHLHRDDINNVFNVSFQTTPLNSSGVAHVLEHVVLCGSEKFPVRDPFFKMLDRSMSTFMNAMTGPDYTMYPFSTQNCKDFKNLMSVYLDSVFFPKINKMDFLQEGWRLEHETNDDITSPIVFKGVVFNEMKGLMADSSYLFGTNLMNKIFPDHTYGVCSGGKPNEILNLTRDDLKNFHTAHYHPSNARFLTYGNFPLVEHLEQINQVLGRFSQIDPGTKVPRQTKWTEPRWDKVSCPPDDLAADPDKQTTFASAFVLPEVCDIDEVFTAYVVCTLLMDGPASPFYKSLIESGLGTDYSPQSGFHNHQRECLFSIGLQGLVSSSGEKVQHLIESTLQRAVKDGFTQARVESVLHKLELQQKHQTSQFGLRICFNVMPQWQHGADCVHLLQFEEMVQKFRQKVLFDGDYLKKKCSEYFITNKHRLDLTMSPTKDYKEKLEIEEKQKLQSRILELDQNSRMDIFTQGQDLAQTQMKPQDLSCLPTLVIDDVERKATNYDVTVTDYDGFKFVTCEQPTNDVTYFNAVLPVNGLHPEMKPYLTLFAEVFTKLGTKSIDYVTMSEREDKFTGGLMASVTSQCGLQNNMATETGIHLHSHCLNRNVTNMFELWREIFNEVVFTDADRLRKLIRQSAQELTNSVSYNGHVFAMKSASRRLSPSCDLEETLHGLSQLDVINSISQMQSLDDVIDRLRHIANYVLCKNVNELDSSRFALHTTSQFMTSAMTTLISFVDSLPESSSGDDLDGLSSAPCGDIQSLVLSKNFEAKSFKRHHELPLAVNFVSLGIQTKVPFTHRHAPVIKILARLMTSQYLHREIREIGGAYGGGAKYGDDGILRFFSYRDPKNLQTIQRYNDSLRWAREGNFNQRQIDEAKLAVFQNVDSPLSPYERGLPYFTTGMNDVIKQEHRNGLLDVTKEQLLEVATKLPDEPSCIGTAVIGPNHPNLSRFK